MTRTRLVIVIVTLVFSGQVRVTLANEILFDPRANPPWPSYRPGIRDVALDADGNYLVIEGTPAAETISVLDPSGKFIREIGRPFELTRAKGLAVSSTGSIYVSTGLRDDPIRVYDANGVLQPSFGNLSGSFQNNDIAIDSKDNVYAVHHGGVHVFDPDGVFQHRISDSTIQRVAIAPNDDIYVANRSIISVYKPDRQLSRTIRMGQVVGDSYPTGSWDIKDLVVDDSAIYVASGLTVHKLDLEGNLEFSSIGHVGASGIALGIDHDLLVMENSPDDSYIRSVDEATLRGWDGSTFTNREHGPYGFFKLVTDGLGFSQYIETSAETFLVPGEPGEQVEMTFTYRDSTAGLRPAFGVYQPEEISADLGDPQSLLIEILEEGEILVERDQNRIFCVGSCSRTIVAEAGTELGFFSMAASLASNPRRPNPSSPLYPSLSEADLNLGGFDQMLALIGEDTTVFAFEDIKIADGIASFGDFTDMVVSVDVALIPVVPEPSTLCMSLMLGWYCLSRLPWQAVKSV